MSITRGERLRSAMDLPESERLLSATELMDSVVSSESRWFLDDPDFDAELERRAQDGSLTVPWEAIRAQFQADLKR